LQKGELLKLLLGHPLRLLPSSLGISHCIGQAPGVLLGHLVSLVRLCELNLEKGGPLNKALYLLVSKS
jgi:hypothetical protein